MYIIWAVIFIYKMLPGLLMPKECVEFIELYAGTLTITVSGSQDDHSLKAWVSDTTDIPW